MDPNFPIRGIQRLADLYGEIYKVNLGTMVIVVSSRALVDEISDQDRFHKDIAPTLYQVRALTGDGLFTSAHEDGHMLKSEPNWWKAHRLLVPAFGPLGLRKMFDDMLDISSQSEYNDGRRVESNHAVAHKKSHVDRVDPVHCTVSSLDYVLIIVSIALSGAPLGSHGP